MQREREKERPSSHAPNLEFRPSMGAETKPSSGTEVAAAAMQFQNQEAEAAAANATNPAGDIDGGAHDWVARKAAAAANAIRQENQVVKRQKLDYESTRQIFDLKSHVLPHKGGGSSARSTKQEVTITPFISTAEIVKKFESGPRDLGSHYSGSMSNVDADTAAQRRLKLMPTRPKEPEFQTTNRVRPVRIKSSLAKNPKFRAQPFNKKIAEAPCYPNLTRAAPQEFHFKTMERASQHSGTCSDASSIGTTQSHCSKPLKQSEAKLAQLETAPHARPSRVKSTKELKLEELEKVPKFKAKLGEDNIKLKKKLTLECLVYVVVVVALAIFYAMFAS